MYSSIMETLYTLYYVFNTVEKLYKSVQKVKVINLQLLMWKRETVCHRHDKATTESEKVIMIIAIETRDCVS